MSNRVVANSEMDLRRAARHRAAISTIIEHSRLGDILVSIVNISAHGFMIDDHDGRMERGDRVLVRLPVIGRIEAHLVWAADARAGFQFERIIRLPDFLSLLEKVSPKR